ncbi:hypothetical protein MTO96_002520 [Rhipicephalus appendiculatus]
MAKRAPCRRQCRYQSGGPEQRRPPAWSGDPVQRSKLQSPAHRSSPLSNPEPSPPGCGGGGHSAVITLRCRDSNVFAEEAAGVVVAALLVLPRTPPPQRALCSLFSAPAALLSRQSRLKPASFLHSRIAPQPSSPEEHPCACACVRSSRGVTAGNNG